MAVSKDVVLAAAILGNGKARGVRAHPEPMDTEGVSFGARFALAGSVVALAWKNAGPRFLTPRPRDVRDARWSDGRRGTRTAPLVRFCEPREVTEH